MEKALHMGKIAPVVITDYRIWNLGVFLLGDLSDRLKSVPPGRERKKILSMRRSVRSAMYFLKESYREIHQQWPE